MRTKQEPDFIDTLVEIGDGDLHRQASETLRECVKAAMRTKKKATMTIKLTFLPGDKQFEVAGHVTKTLPHATVDSSMFFPTKEGSLTRENPRQREFEGFTHDVVKNPTT